MNNTFYKFCFLLCFAGMQFNASGQLIITAVYDGPISHNPRGVELFVESDIPDLSIYGVGCANNGGGTDNVEFSFPAIAAFQGEFLYVAYQGLTRKSDNK